MSDRSHLSSDLDCAIFLQDTLIGAATNDGIGGDADDYSELRQHFLKHPTLKSLLPDCVRVRRTSNEFWQFIKHHLPTYRERREYIWAEMRPLITHLEGGTSAPADTEIQLELAKLDAEHINYAWQKALERKATDPDGAVTMAKTMLESVCKHILEKQNVELGKPKMDLPELYKKAASAIGLAVNPETGDIQKQILGGCSGIVSGIGELRNKVGDAHGKVSGAPTATASQASLAVNLAGAMSLFLLEALHQFGES
jgi:hypothetical protein